MIATATKRSMGDLTQRLRNLGASWDENDRKLPKQSHCCLKKKQKKNDEKNNQQSVNSWNRSWKQTLHSVPRRNSAK